MHCRRALPAWALVVGAAGAVLTGCTGDPAPVTPSSAGVRGTTSPATVPVTSAPSSTTHATTVPATTVPAPAGVAKWPQRILLAQLLMVADTYADLPAASDDVQAGAGGLVLLGQAGAGTAPALTAGLAALQREAPVPVLVATDEEGGGVARLTSLVGSLPWPRTMAGDWTPAEVTTHLGSVASAMRSFGIEMDLAPVVDTASPSDQVDDEAFRSFSEDGSTASSYALAFLKGLAAGGVVGVVKHFPGLGHANGDTDLTPASDPPLGRLTGDDLVPFRAAIRAGVRVVMMSNVTEPDWGTAPASINSAAYSYLRGMGFEGMVITDAIDAGAVKATGADPGQATVEAIEAGADMVILGAPWEFPSALADLEAAVASGRLSMSKVVADVDRVVAVKALVFPGAKVLTSAS